MTETQQPPVGVDALRAEVQEKYRAVAVAPNAEYHFHTGRRLKSRATASQLGLTNVEFREGFAEALPVDDHWADVVISNGVTNLCADKRVIFAEIRRVLRPGGVLQFADIANGRPVPPEALRDIDLWTG